MNLLRGPLRPGARLGLFCPGSAPDPTRIAGVARFLERAEYKWSFGPVAARRAARGTSRLHAALPEERAAEIATLARDPEVDALFALRGGSGTLGILPLLDYQELRAARKCVIGMSDLTALSLALLAHAELPSLAAPMGTQLSVRPPIYTTQRWRAALEGREARGIVATATIDGLRTLYHGEAEGRLLPCNLSLLVAVVGTAHCPSLDGAILLLEDVGETPQSLDRMVERLRLSGACDRLAGVVFGQFTRCLPREPEVFESDGPRLLHAWARSLGVPALHGFPHGHEAVCATLPFGARARLSTEPPRIELLESIWDPSA